MRMWFILFLRLSSGSGVALTVNCLSHTVLNEDIHMQPDRILTALFDEELKSFVDQGIQSISSEVRLQKSNIYPNPDS